MTISSPKYGLIRLSSIDDANIPGPSLPGSKTFISENKFGTILLQEFHSDPFIIRYSIFNFLKNIRLLFANEVSGLTSKLLLKGSLTIRKQNTDKLHLKAGQFILAQGHGINESIVFDKGKECIVFDTEYSFEMLRKLISAFPSLAAFIDEQNSSDDALITQRPAWASTEMIEIVHQLLRSPYDEDLRKLYFENKINDYLLEQLVLAFKTFPALHDLQQKDKHAVIRAKELITKDLTKHFTIREISQEVQLNQFKLKVGFKQHFGVGMFEYLLNARMEKARQLLIETDKPIKEIAAITGYDHLTNFITAFRKFFGYTPGSLRR